MSSSNRNQRVSESDVLTLPERFAQRLQRSDEVEVTLPGRLEDVGMFELYNTMYSKQMQGP